MGRARLRRAARTTKAPKTNGAKRLEYADCNRRFHFRGAVHKLHKKPLKRNKTTRTPPKLGGRDGVEPLPPCSARIHHHPTIGEGEAAPSRAHHQSSKSHRRKASWWTPTAIGFSLPRSGPQTPQEATQAKKKTQHRPNLEGERGRAVAASPIPHPSPPT
jgi:hypothetical protein